MNVATAICPVSAAGMRRNPWLLYLPHSPPSANVNGTFYMFLKSVPFPIGPALVQPLNQPLPGLLHVPLDWPSFLQPLLALIHPLRQSVSGHTTFYWITVLLLSSNPWDWHTGCYYNQYYAWPLSTSCVLPMSLSMPQKSYLTYITPERHAASHLLAFASAAADIWSTLPRLQISEYFIISPPVKTSSQVPLITEWTVYFMWLHVTNY